ncbi:MAG: hypothetical protein ACFB10_16090 [Salibacteraceae bacterium]
MRTLVLIGYLLLFVESGAMGQSLCLNSQLNSQNQQEINAEKSYSGLTAGQIYTLSFDVTSIDPTINLLVDDGNSLQSISIANTATYTFNLQPSGTSAVLMVQSITGKKQPRFICLDNLHLESVSQQVTTVVYKEPVNDYRYAFNGQEKDDEIAGLGNSNTATFWQYDSRLGRRWNLDPKPNSSISSYATFANNPIRFADPLGDTIKGNDAAMAKYEAFKQDLLGKITNTQELLDRAQVSLKGAMNKKEAREANRNISSLTHRLSVYNAAQSELSVLENSTQVYLLTLSNDVGSAKGGFIKYKPSKRIEGVLYEDVLQVNINLSAGNPFAKMAHEFKHAYQFDSYQITFDQSNTPAFDYLNVADEVEAYRRQWFFEPLQNPDKTPVLSYSLINREWVLNRSEVYQKLRDTPTPQSTVSKEVLARMKAHNLKTYNAQMSSDFEFYNWRTVGNMVYYRGWKQDLKIK